MTWSAAALAVALFPTGDHHELSLGSYGFETAPGFSTAVDAPQAGIALRYRRVFDTDDPDITPTGETARLRLSRTADGGVAIDRLEVETLLATFRIRPELGDKLDVGLLFGTWDEIWIHGDSGRGQWRLHTPITLTVLGFANNDMDADDRIKWYAAAGAGVGGDWIRRVRGPIGVQARADTRLHTRVRWWPGSPATTRHEWISGAELGLTWLRDRQVLGVQAWAEAVTQWDPRDAEGRDGIDRQYLAAGLAVTGRLYQGRQAQAEPDLAVLAGELDAVAALAELEAAEAEGAAVEGETAEVIAPLDGEPAETEVVESAEAPAGPPASVVDGPPADPGILTVHWSELEVVERFVAVGDGPDGTCSIRIVLDAEGVPTDVEAAGCPEHLVEPARDAGLRWRFKPFLEGDRAIPVQAVFPIQFEPPP